MIKVARYDGNLSPHAHFICLKCEKIFDVYQKFEDLKHKKLKVELTT